MVIEIVDLPIKIVIFHSYVSLPKGINPNPRLHIKIDVIKNSPKTNRCYGFVWKFNKSTLR